MSHPLSAILVVEFQKTWTQKSFFHFLIKHEYQSRNIYQNSTRLLDVARKSGIAVIQSPFILDKNDRQRYKKIPLLPKLLGQFTAGTWRAEYTEGIFQEGDLEVTGRTAFDNTIDSDLVDILTRLHVGHVYIMGFTTDHCVAETIDSLEHFGFSTTLISDATATFNRKKQQAMEEKYPSITTADLIKKIQSP